MGWGMSFDWRWVHVENQKKKLIKLNKHKRQWDRVGTCELWVVGS